MNNPKFDQTELEEAGKSLSFDKVISLAMKTPGIKVDRETFLFNNFGNNPELKTKRPIDLFSIEVLNKRAKAAISTHTAASTIASAATGIPGGFAILPAAVADIVQYYANFLIIIQKLGYIYGWPDLKNKKGDFDENTINALMVYLGCAMGVSAANKLIQELAESAGKAAANKIAKTAVTKTLWYPILKQIMAAFNKKLTKELAAQIAKKVVPGLGALISGSLTLASFTKATNRLKNKLIEEQEFSTGLENHFVYTVLE